MSEQLMSLVERLRNPAWESGGEGEPARLNIEQTREAMEEAADGSPASPRVSPQRDILLALAERCGREEPSWELDARIEQAIAPDKIVLFDPGSVGPVKREAVRGPLRDFPMDGWEGTWAWEAVAREVGSKRYTTSLDAAVTLVPEGCGIDLQRYWRSEPGVWWSAGVSWGTSGECADVMDRPTAALALCAVALRAHAALAEQTQAPPQAGEADSP